MRIPRVRFSLLAVMATVAGSALAVAALRSASDLWLSATYTFCVLVLLSAAVAARVRRGRTGDFWAGFAAFGWGFLLLSGSPWERPLSYVQSGEGGGLNSNLLTTRLLLKVVPRLRGETPDLDRIDRATENAIGVARLLVTMGMAACGGGLALALRGRRRGPRGPAGPRVVGGSAALTALILLAGGPASGEPPSASSYFGEALREDPVAIRASRLGRFAEALRAMGEPPLRPSRPRSVYRLLYLPSFSHPVAIRVEQTAAGATLRAVALDGHGGYRHGRVALERVVRLSASQWRELEGLAAGAGFWSLAATDPQDEGYSDGAHYAMEGADADRRHLVDRMDLAGPYAAFWRRAFELSGLVYGDLFD